MKCLLAWLWVALTLFARPAPAQEETSVEPDANPGRPTVSTPATLTPKGYLQFETGALRADHSPEFSSRFGFNEVMKLSVTAQTAWPTYLQGRKRWYARARARPRPWP
jgi:hypothetical protein